MGEKAREQRTNRERERDDEIISIWTHFAPEGQIVLRPSNAESVEEVDHNSSLIHWVGGDQLALSNKLLMIMPMQNLLTRHRTTRGSRVMM